MKTKILIFISLIFTLSLIPVFANQYDDEERIRRFLEKAAAQEKAERELAKKRIDQEEREKRINSSSDDTDALSTVLMIAMGGVLYFVIKMSK